ncbi:acetyl-CoA carboxylase biotin carboxyl carrier protein [Pseudomarimonas arenosa]|nr:biotin/lipoyl-containing protein [Pseudomarimonas arenosa]
METSSLAEVEVRDNGVDLRVTRSPRSAASLAQHQSPTICSLSQAEASGPDEHIVRSPRVGICYASPGPDQPPFVSIGGTVQRGDTLGIVSALSTVSPIKAHASGTMLRILVENGQPVEFDQPLFVIG